jgi:hypothetical protein
LAKGKKKGTGDGPAELLVIEAEQFPSVVIVELWHKTPKGKREFLDSRRFEAVVPEREGPIGEAQAPNPET